MKAKLIELWSKLNPAQAFFLSVCATGVFWSLSKVPADFWSRVDWQWWAGFILAATGASGSALANKLLKDDK